MTLVLEHVDKRFGANVAAQDVSFTVPEASVFGLLGPNGAGKTTTIRMIVDILRPDAGRILWRGTPVHAIARREVGYMPEERGLYADMPVGEHVRFFARVRGLAPREADAHADAWLERMALTGMLATIALALWLAGRIYRVGILAYGQRLGLRRLLRLAREA